MTTSGLTAVLILLYPDEALLFIALITIDFVSHYVHMYASLAQGADSHKSSEANVNPILRFYYTFPFAMFFMILGNEGYFVLKFLMAAEGDGPVVFGDTGLFVAAYYVAVPLMAVKQFMNVVQGLVAFNKLVTMDVAAREANKAKST